MRRLPKRKGVSLGTVIMLLITASVVAGCVMLFPKLSGDVDIRISPAQIAVVLDESLRNGTFSLSGGQTVDMPSNQPLAKATSAPGTETAYSQPQPVATAVPTQRLSFRLTAGGLLSFSSNLQKSALTDDQYDFEPILQPLSQSVQGELSLATLQNTIVGTEKYNDLNMPVQALAAVQRAGLNTLCMGFPGVLGNGLTGLTATIGALQSANLTPYGVYPSAQARMTPVMVQAGGVNVALLSYQSELSSASKKRTSSEEQEFAIARPTVKSIEEDIKTARQSGAQVVIVSLCWGKTTATSPAKAQTELAQQVADAGADVILGTHPDAVQSVEVLTSVRADGSKHKTVCAYSLGTLLTSDRENRTKLAGMLLHMTVGYDPQTQTVTFESLSYTPTYIWRGKADGKVFYRVLPSKQGAPEGMDKDQAKVMERCLKLVRDAMSDSPVAEANE